MSLLHPTPGEMADRLIIVELKITAYQHDRRDADRLMEEKYELSDRLKYYPLRKPINFDGMITELRDLHADLWKAEDMVRSDTGGDPWNLASQARSIARMNDDRNRMIREIDIAYGCENPVEEKIYSCTQKK